MSRRLLTFTSVIALASLAACGDQPEEPAPQTEQAQTTPNDAPAGEYMLDTTHASVTFTVSHWGLSNYTARFSEMSGNLNYDPADPVKNSVEVTINPASIRTDYPYNDIRNPRGDIENFDTTLATEENWFNVGEYPTITFKSTAVEQTGDTTAKVTGDLTFRGVTKPVVLDVTYNGSYAKLPMAPISSVGFSGKTTIKRSEFGMGFLTPSIGDEVNVLIEAEFVRPVAGAMPPEPPPTSN